VIDNSGALLAECINVIGKSSAAKVGDEIVCVVKKARPIVEGLSSSTANAGKVKKGDVLRGLVVRTKGISHRWDGSSISFDDNAVVMLNKQGQPVGNRILGVVAEECRQKRWAKVVAMAPKII
jgi:large subunit ribosomal protein L14